MVLLKDEGRDYRRFSHTTTERLYLSQQGFQHVQSSNVSAVAQRGDDMIIRFHNGSLYRYAGKGEHVPDIIRSNSKGKWVWRNLRRKRVAYEKIGALPLPDDLGITDEDLFRELDDRYLKDLVKALGITPEVIGVIGANGLYNQINLGAFTFYVPR